MSLLGRWWTLVTVRGHSMAPTLHDRQRLLVRRLRRPPRRGDVIVFVVPGWLAETMPGVAHVPAGHVVVAGDNQRSQDSRHLGLVAVGDIVGTVPV